MLALFQCLGQMMSARDRHVPLEPVVAPGNAIVEKISRHVEDISHHPSRDRPDFPFGKIVSEGPREVFHDRTFICGGHPDEGKRDKKKHIHHQTVDRQRLVRHDILNEVDDKPADGVPESLKGQFHYFAR